MLLTLPAHWSAPAYAIAWASRVGGAEHEFPQSPLDPRHLSASYALWLGDPDAKLHHAGNTLAPAPAPSVPCGR